MKLHLHTFKCSFDEADEMVTLICDPDIKSFLFKHNIPWNEFNPDFVNEKMNQFVFCTQNKEWDAFVELFYRKCDVKIVLHEIPTPDGINGESFDIYKFYQCNSMVIKYILFPESRNRTFLMQNTHAICDDYFIRKLHRAISNPKESKVYSLYKLKMLWITLRSHGGQEDFLSHRRRNLTWFDKHFYFIYRFLYFHVICHEKLFSPDLRTDFLSCSKRLVQELIDQEGDIDDNIHGFYEESIQLPF